MKKYLALLLLICTSYGSAASWSTAGTIPAGSAATDVNLAYYPNIKKVVAAWSNLSDHLPYYSVYNGTSWSTALPFLISNTITVNDNVTLQSFPKLKIMVAAWGDRQSPNSPYYSIFDGTNWSTPLVINPSSPLVVFDDIAMTYDKKNNRIVAAWAPHNFSYGDHPVYSIFDTTMTWTQAMPITVSYIAQEGDVSLTYNKAAEQVVAAWVSLSSSPYFAFDPIYSIFDVNTSTWSTPALIPIAGPGTDVGNLVKLGSSITNNQVFAAWGTTVSPNPIYGNTYNGSWNPTATALPMYGSSGTIWSVSFGVNKTNGDIFNAWHDESSNKPYYSINSLALGGTIPQGLSTAVFGSVNLTYDETSAQMIAAWTDAGAAHTIYFNTYQ